MTLETRLTFSQRSQLCTNPTAKRLFQLMDAKKTNLAVSVDTTDAAHLLYLAELLGPEICVLKTHIDILSNFTPKVTDELVKIAEKHHFLLFEDRKFCDIGATVRDQYREGIYRIADWSPITNAHIIPGPGIIAGLREVGLPKGNGLLLVAEMSSVDNLANGTYTEKAIEMAYEYSDFVIGFICQRKLTERPEYIHMTPGVNLHSKGDKLGQRYLTPEIAVGNNGSDVIIVGRGITESVNPLEEAKRYKSAGYHEVNYG